LKQMSASLGKAQSPKKEPGGLQNQGTFITMSSL
jgi:hypothetical protein